MMVPSASPSGSRIRARFTVEIYTFQLPSKQVSQFYGQLGNRITRQAKPNTFPAHLGIQWEPPQYHWILTGAASVPSAKMAALCIGK